MQASGERQRAIGAFMLVCGLAMPIMAQSPGAGAATGPETFTQTVVPYSCAGAGFASYLGTLPTQNVNVMMIAPTEVTVGQTFTVKVDISPLVLAASPVAIASGGLMPLSPTGATGTSGGSATGATVVVSGTTYTVPRMSMVATPTAAAGGTATFTAGNIAIVQGSTGFACSRVPGAAAATISTRIVASLTTTTVPGQTTTTTTAVPATTIPGQTTTTTTTIPGQTTTTAAPTTTIGIPPTTAPPTTAAPTTTAPGATTVPDTIVTTTAAPPTVPPIVGTTAVIVTPSASATFSCNIYDDTGTKFNQNPLPASRVTVTMTLPDKVGVGGTISGLVRMNPGPANGPIALKAGTVNFAMDLVVSGATPGSVRVTGGPNGSTIAPNAVPSSPDMSFRLTTTSAAGSEVAIGVKQVEVIATSPTKLTTRCLPSGSAMNRVAGVSVLSGAVVAPAQITRTGGSGSTSTGSSTSGTASDGGYANCAAARADGRGTIVKTDPAYRTRLDGDNDGLACEAGDPQVLGTSLARTGESHSLMLVSSALLIGFGSVVTLTSGTRRRRSSAHT